eukprot:scaffold41027_cov53-Cyclotella_meneghiniana.AAC.2
MATFDEIEDLCRNRSGLSDFELVLRLQKFSQINPRVFSERDEDGLTLLHHAVMGRSPEFCRVIHDQNNTLVKIQDEYGCLPLHYACSYGSVKTAKYLLELYPDSIHIPNDDNEYPLHLLACAEVSNENKQEFLLFLLKHNKGAVSTPTHDGDLPLHIACETKELAFVKLLFDAHPDGIFVRDSHIDTPLEIARFFNKADAVHFFETQLEFHRQAQEDQDPDVNGQLPIHRVLQMQNENVSLGTIKLMVGAHRASVTVADYRGCIPLHYACRLGDLNIVKYLADNDKNSLATLDSGGNLPLHHACLAGKPDTVSYILDTTDQGVGVRNHDGKLPIQILLFDAICDRELQYVDAVDSLFRANPVDSLAIISPGLYSLLKSN